MPPMPLPNGNSFAGYQLSRQLGADATSELYLAQGPDSPDPVVLRIVAAQPSADPTYQRAFADRLESVSDLTHPNLPRVRGYGEYDGRLWSAVEALDGPTCGRLLAKRYPDGLPRTATAVILRAVADALDHLHRRGVAHGAVRPDLIQLTRPDAVPRRILLNGLDTVPDRLSDPASDRTAFAVTAFHLVTGRIPDPTRPVPASTLRPAADVDAAADDALAAALADPNAYSSNRAFADDLTAALDVDTRAPAAGPSVPPPAPPPPPASARRPAANAPRRALPRALTAVGAVLAILVLVAVAAFFVRDRYYRSEAAPLPEEPATSEASPTAVPPPAAPACGEGDALLAQMTQRQKLAQLLAVGVTGLADAQQVVANEQVGGIMIGSWTDKSMLGPELIALSGSASPLPLAVSTDEEGGRVSRLSNEIGVQPSAREIVQQGWTVERVYAEAFRRGQAMRGLGITVDFAPVVDVSDQPDDTVIGDRSFSDDPSVVTDYAGEYARGLHDAGVMPVFKHFPGHGQASGDSHEGGVTTPDLESLKARDLIPYRSLVNRYGAAVMVGHMNVPGLTNGEQASLSGAAYRLLRDGAGYGAPPFGGLIFTDDLSSMGAINQSYSVPEAVLKALQAGADVALWITTDDVTAVLDRLEEAVAAGQLDSAAVDRSVLRIAASKGRSTNCGG